MTSVHSTSPLLALLALLACTAVARGERVESFEGPDPSWRFLSSDASSRIEKQERSGQDPHSGEFCEQLRILSGPGTSCYFGHAIGPARLIDELAPRVWIKADRPGVKLSARVVFPRSIDPSSGRAVSTLVHGDTLSQRNAWQQLTMPPLGPLVKSQLRVLRSQLGRDIDPREAYVDLIVINAFGGAGPIHLSIDDLDCDGLVPLEAVAARRVATDPLVRPNSAPPLAATPAAPNPSAAPPDRVPTVRLRNGQLLAADRPIFPHVVEFQGEPLDYLRALGFGAVRLSQPPTPALLDEARRTGMWLVVPATPETVAAATAEQWPVLAYHAASSDDAIQTASSAGHDRAPIVEPLSPIASKPGAAKGIGRVDLHPLLSGRDWPTHFQSMRRIAATNVPNSMLWATMPTEPDATLAAQWARFESASDPRWSITPEQIRLLAYMNLAAGARGFDFPSQTPLIGRGPTSRWRQASIELLLLEWDLLAPWGAVGIPLAVWQHDAETYLAMWSIERATLLIVFRAPANSQFVADAPGNQPLRVMIPGAAETADALHITSSGLRPLVKERVAGGLRIEVDSIGHAAAIVITADPLVQGSLARKIATNLPRVARLEQEIAGLAAAETTQLLQRAQASPNPLPGVEGALAEAQQLARQAAELTTASDFAGAVTIARRSRATLARIARTQWDRSQLGSVRYASHPLAASFPSSIRLGEIPISTANPIVQPIGGGSAEEIASLRNADWWSQANPEAAVGGVELSPRAAHSGEKGIRVFASAPTTLNLEAGPIGVTFSSAAVRVGEKRLICVRGWVRTPAPLAGDGLSLHVSGDSPTLALPIRYAPRWQPFEIYRATATATDLRLFGRLETPGEIWLDDLECVDLGPLPESSSELARLPVRPQPLRLERLPAP